MALDFQTIFKAIKESPTAAIMSLLVIGISVMFTINQRADESIKSDLRKANKDCATEKYIVQSQMERLNEKYIEVFGSLREVQSQLKTLQKLGVIKE